VQAEYGRAPDIVDADLLHLTRATKAAGPAGRGLGRGAGNVACAGLQPDPLTRSGHRGGIHRSRDRTVPSPDRAGTRVVVAVWAPTPSSAGPDQQLGTNARGPPSSGPTSVARPAARAAKTTTCSSSPCRSAHSAASPHIGTWCQAVDGGVRSQPPFVLVVGARWPGSLPKGWVRRSAGAAGRRPRSWRPRHRPVRPRP
jgi:hypothetical protein